MLIGRPQREALGRCATPMSILALSPVSCAYRCFSAKKALSTSANILLFRLPFKFPARRKILTDAHVFEDKDLSNLGGGVERGCSLVMCFSISGCLTTSTPLPDKRGCSNLEEDLLILLASVFY